MTGRAAWVNEQAKAMAEDAANYDRRRASDTLGAPYEIPGSLLHGILQEGEDAHQSECPLLCFVNAQSGSRKGAKLAEQFSRAIGRMQVFDIGNRACRPDIVLGKLYDNFRVQEAAGDPRVALVKQRLRLVVCGGDGTIAWVMGAIKKLKLQPEPPIAIIPLGTGNDLARSFLWGHAFQGKWIRSRNAMYKSLHKIATATEDRLDCWSFVITAPRKDMLQEKGLPHGLSSPQPAASGLQGSSLPHHARISAPSSVPGTSGYGRVHSSSLPNVAGAGPVTPPAGGPGGDRSVAASMAPSMAATLGSATPLHNIATSSVGSAVTAFTTATNMSMHTGAAQAGTSVPPTIVSGAVSTQAEEETGVGSMMGMFWNYFSVGLDARAAWGFHSLRNRNPWATSSRHANQFWYSYFGCASGWFCCAEPVSLKVTLEILKPGPGADTSGWQPVKLPPEVKALVVLNLQSYAGGRDLWGGATGAADSRKHGWRDPSYNDGTLEVVGLLSGWHTALVMGSKGALLHGKRICQAAGVRLAVQAPEARPDGEPRHCYMQLDGEPWKQEVPSKDQGTPVRVEIRHAGVSRVLRNDRSGGVAAAQTPGSPNVGGGSADDEASKDLSPPPPSSRPTANLPIVSAASEPASLLVRGSAPVSQSQSSVQMSTMHHPLAGSLPSQASASLPLHQALLPGQGAIAATTAGESVHGPVSTSGTVLLQRQASGATHASSSVALERAGGGVSGPARLGSVGRASGAGSSVAEAVEGAGEDSMGAGASVGAAGAGGGTVRVRQQGGGGGSSMYSPVNGAMTPRTSSGDLDSQGGRCTRDAAGEGEVTEVEEIE